MVTGDVRQMHQSNESAGALFQVASQFNLLEMTGPEVAGGRRHPLPTRPHARPGVRNRRRRGHDIALTRLKHGFDRNFNSLVLGWPRPENAGKEWRKYNRGRGRTRALAGREPSGKLPLMGEISLIGESPYQMLAPQDVTASPSEETVSLTLHVLGHDPEPRVIEIQTELSPALAQKLKSQLEAALTAVRARINRDW